MRCEWRRLAVSSLLTLSPRFSSLLPLLHKNVPFNWRLTLLRHLVQAPRDSGLFVNVKELLMGQSQGEDALFTMFTDAKEHLAGRGRKEHTLGKSVDARASPLAPPGYQGRIHSFSGLWE